MSATDSNKESQALVAQYSAEMNLQLATPDVKRALLATTFKGLSEMSMKQAIVEGMMTGYTFKDFLKKDVYALPFKDGYSLVTAISRNRKIAMRSGLAGKSAPVWEFDENKKPLSCTVTVKRRVDGNVDDYTATVYFEEYTTGRNLWLSKPKTMIAKVAEVHALRMAFPEELGKDYIEEEMEKEATPRSFVTNNEVAESGLKMGNLKKKQTANANTEKDEAAPAEDEAESPAATDSTETG